MDLSIIPIIKKIEQRLESIQQSSNNSLKLKRESTPPPKKNVSVKKNKNV